MTNTILQVPMGKEVRARATQVASEYGLSSLQEAVRIYVHQLANKEVRIGMIEEPAEKLSPKGEKRYAKMIADIKKGKNMTKTKNLDDLFKLLNS